MSLWSRIFLERRALILPIAIVLVANLGVLLLAVLPLARSVASLELQAADGARRLDAAKRESRQAKDARASKDRAELELQKFYAEKLPSGLNIARRVTTAWLQQAVSDAGVAFKGFNAAHDEVRDSRLTRVTVKYTLQGRYADIRKLLYAIETAEEFVVVEKVELTQAATNTQTPTGQLEVGLTVSTYFVTPPGS